jgi:hypothetical protein
MATIDKIVNETDRILMKYKNLIDKHIDVEEVK